MHDDSRITTFLFTDIEGSTRLWEQQPERMRPALAQHDALAREAVAAFRGQLVKSTGDGIHAAFADPADAIAAALHLQRALADPAATEGLALQVRCGLHCGRDERRDGDFFGTAVNRAARIMSAAHGGQVLLSQAVADKVREALPEGCALRDLGSVRLRDLAHPERVFQLLHAQLRADFPPLRSLERTPNNLPLALTTFVGRERELAAVGELLAKSRLVTVLGMGGLGKSRLSLEAAANAIDDFPDGVWLVELAALKDPGRVSEAVASVLGIKEQPGVSIAATVGAWARERKLLLVLDNCEHVAAACAAFARELLQTCAGLKILASSREPLQIPGEAALPLAPLAVPSARAALEAGALLQYDSVRLFVERAAMARPGFAIEPQNAPAITAICHRLDGIPLAIELAAARLRSMPVQTLAARINNRYRLLSSGDPTASPRQRTLRALIDWSYDLLDDHERALFRRLAVFAGSFDLQAAEAVSGAGGVDVLDVLAHLVNKSLVIMEGERYRMLETVREYAELRLRETDEAADALAAHARHFVAFAEKARTHLVGPDQADWLVRLDVEHDNVMAAHGRCDAIPGGVDLDLRLVRAMKMYWINRGLLTIAHGAALAALERSGEGGRSRLHCNGLFDAGQLSYFMGRYGEARRYLGRCGTLFREAGHTAAVAAVLQPLGMACLAEGDVAAAREFLQEALQMARAMASEREVAAALTALAQLERVTGSASAAQSLCREALAITQRMGDRESIAVGQLNLAMMAIDGGDRLMAARLLQEALAHIRETGSKAAGQCLLEVATALAALREDWLRAARLLGSAEARAAESGLHRDPADDAFLQPWVRQIRDRLPAAQFEAAMNAGGALDFEHALREADESLGAEPMACH